MAEDKSNAGIIEAFAVTVVTVGEAPPKEVWDPDDYWIDERQTNPEPAFEEGPHLQDPDIRAAKRKQLIDAGFDHEDERLTPDMAAILKEKE